MNRKLFGRDGARAQLQDLYRQAEQGGDVRDVDPEVQQAFAADQRLMQQLGHLADQSAPVNPAIGRATLLAAVAQKRGESPEGGRGPLIGRLLTGRALALLATAGIFAGGAVTVGASGGVDDAAGNVQNVLATLHITERTPSQATTHLDGAGQPDSSGNALDAGHPSADTQLSLGANDCTTTPTVTLTATSTATATSTPTASTTAENHDGDRGADRGRECETKGIPTTNPSHQPDQSDGTCQKGDTAVKTTPSGVAVNVPCQTGQDHGQGSGDKTRVSDETPEANATEPNKHSNEADKTPDANATESHDGSDEGADHTPVPLPTEANHHATESAGNATDH